ncbi:MAG: TnpV protein [Butyrivibrio sp.]|nr:TnpV protein [Butyrivibrio sp.]
MKIDYMQAGDFMVPNIVKNQEPEEVLTKFGLMRKNYLKENKKPTYTAMLLEGELQEHCLEIQKQAEERMDFLMDQMAKNEGVDEALKASDQMEWVRRMNNIKAMAEENVTREIIFN